MASNRSLSIDEGTLALYLATETGEFVDLEVAATAAIHWAKGLKAAASALDPTAQYRVTLVAARPGSSNWIAKLEELRETVENSAINRFTERTAAGWKKMPIIVRLGLGLAVAVPVTIKPTIEYWLGDESFSETEKRQLEEIYRKVHDEPTVKAQRRAIFKEAPRDRKITGIGTGIPSGEHWRPKFLIPADRFAEADGLFDIEDDVQEKERTVPQTLDVILVTPRLENARRAWTFRQEGIPGTFNAEMTDTHFLQALDRPGGIRETMRANIPMRIDLEIDMERVNGEWKVKQRGRRVVRVLSPEIG